MKADASNEQRFIADVDAFEFIAHDLGRILHSMEDWLAQLGANLQSSRLLCQGLNEQGAMAKSCCLGKRCLLFRIVRAAKEVPPAFSATPPSRRNPNGSPPRRWAR